MMHHLFHGPYLRTLSDFSADLICTSPPYNIGSKSRKYTGRRKYGLFDRKSYGAIRGYADNLPEQQYQEEQVQFLRWCLAHLSPNGILAYNHKPRRRKNRLIHPMEWILQVSEFVLVEEIIWDRSSTHNHAKRMMWPQTERIYILKKLNGSYRLENTRELPQRSDLWRIPKARVNGHPAPFPEALVEAIVLAWSQQNDLVMDPYAGSGTVGVVARRLGRRFVGAEILSKYYHQALQRIVEA